MNGKQIGKHDRLSRVRDHSITSPSHFPPNSRRAQLLAEIDVSLEEVNRNAAIQAVGFSALRESTINKKAARDALQVSMTTIRNAAATLDGASPGLAEQFRLPHGKSDQV